MAVGDIVIGFYGDRSGIAALEQVMTTDVDIAEIVARWEAQHVCVDHDVEVWEAQPGGFYKQREKTMHFVKRD